LGKTYGTGKGRPSSTVVNRQGEADPGDTTLSKSWIANSHSWAFALNRLFSSLLFLFVSLSRSSASLHLLIFVFIFIFIFNICICIIIFLRIVSSTARL
jgi:hypothetical protein